MLRTAYINYGSDPELFLKRRGKVIGSERVIPPEGLGSKAGSQVVIDGVQVELHPRPGATTLSLGHSIATCMRYLHTWIKDFPDVEISLDPMVIVDRAELDQMSEETRQLGCQPSDNFYGAAPIEVDGATYLTRTAGGHIHLDLLATGIYNNAEIDERYRLAVLDILVGNTLVLLDRDVSAAIRRENYGRAGEHRKPGYGIEYRTPSNFWLRNYTLLSLVGGLCNMAISVVGQTLNDNNVDYEMELTKYVDIDKIRTAINENDFNLALENFQRLRPFFVRFVSEHSVHPINVNNIDTFLHFVKGVNEYGLNLYFPNDPVKSWIGREFTEFKTFLSMFNSK